jgi:uncharacterized membrane protein
MAFAGRLHPLLIHFPIALGIAALVAEAASIAWGNERWRLVGVTNIRAAAMFAVVSVLAGWTLAGGEGVDASPLLEWHRWIGTMAAAATLVAAAASAGIDRSMSRHTAYRLALVAAGALMAVAGHLGGVLVWGADFLRP